MRLLDRTLGTIEENLALDEALLVAAEEGTGGETLRLWEWPRYAVVLGSGCKVAEEVDLAACEADGVPVLRRSSGGGTVLLGPGCLLYSLILRFDRAAPLAEITPSYAYILGRVCDSLRDAVPDIHPAGTSDLAVGELKCSGNSQQRKRAHVLHHGTLLYAFDLPRVSRYLRPPPRQPEYRAGREHQSFITNLGLSADDLKRRLRAAWAEPNPPGPPSLKGRGEKTPLSSSPLPFREGGPGGLGQGNGDWEGLDALVSRLVAEKYASPDWTHRR